MNSPAVDVNSLLATMANGDDQAAEKLFPLVYDELHRIATHYMNGERGDHTLGPTALIHEAYLKLVKAESSDQSFENIDHFVATAAVVMRRVLVNHAKAKKAAKRGGGRKPSVQLDELAAAFDNRAVDLLTLDEALVQLEQLDKIQFRLVELKFFGGMSMERCAKLLGISARAAYYEWSHARAWLKTQLADGETS